MKVPPPDMIDGSYSDELSSQFSTTSEGETIFIRGIHRFYRALGRFVARNAWAVIFVCMIITVIGAIKVKHTPKRSDLSGYAPYGARSRYELAAYEQFFDHQGQGIKIMVMLMATDNGTMIRDTHLKEVVNVIDFISKNFTIYNSREQKHEGFDEYCYGFCLYNEPVRQFYNGYQIQTLNPTSRINLSYPVTSMFGRTFSLQPNFFGIKKYSQNGLEEFDAKNKTILTNMKEAKMILLQFRGERDESWTDEQIKAYEIAISEYFIKDYKNPFLKVLVVSNSYAQKEIQRGGLKLQPFLAVGFVIMVFFTVITELISSAFAHQCSWYKVINAVTACIVPFCSVGAAFGMLFFAGFRFGPIILVTPFLILAIGVDDSFLMMHAWQRVVSKLRKHPRPDDTIEYRIAEVLAESGPSITISALTNIMAFIVGALTSPPEVELFCYANAFTLFVDTVFSVTLYAAIMAICGKQEMKSENQTSSSSLKLQKHLQKAKNACYNFLDIYINLLTKVSVSIFIIILLTGYLALTTYGTLNLGIDLSAYKFFLKDSILLEAEKYRSEYVIPYFTPAAIIVNNPGNLSDLNRIEKLNNFIQSFETMNNSIGSDATKYFLRDYEEYKDPFGDLPAGIKPFNAADLDDFLSWPEYSFWKGFLKIKTEKNGSKVLDKFFVNVGFEGKELVNWEERGRLLKVWRDEVDKYQDTFNATIFSDDALFLDLIKVIPSVSWQSAAATLICMAIACFLFMYDPFTVIVASLSICSICLGIFGFLHFWSISQDPIMMAAVIMSIGFSVDIPAHIAFHYYRTGVTSLANENPSVKDRLKHTLAAVGFPVIQAGVSTCLCVLSLLMVPMYMSEVFVKTMFLCIVLGLIHGLFVMPTIFNLYQKLRTNCFSRNRRQEKEIKNVTLKGVKFFEDFENPKRLNVVAPA